MEKRLALLVIEQRQRLCGQWELALTGIGMGVVLLLQVANYLLGSPVWFSVLFLIPISLVTWCVGLAQGILTAVICALPYVVCDSLSAAVDSHSTFAYWNSAVRLEFFFLIILVVSISKMKRRHVQEKLAESTMALEAELEKRQWAEPALKNLEMNREELRQDSVVGVHQSSLKGEILRVVDLLAEAYVASSK
jgi:hypothetical protein